MSWSGSPILGRVPYCRGQGYEQAVHRKDSSSKGVATRGRSPLMLIVPVVGVDVLRHGAAQQRDDLKDTDLTDANLLPYDERDPERLSLYNLKRTDRRMDLSREKLRPRSPMLH